MTGEDKISILADLGYDSFFRDSMANLDVLDCLPARVIAEYKGLYKVMGADGEYYAKVTGKQIYNASSREEYPAVGDWVAIADFDGDKAVIRGVLPRKTILKRKNVGKQEAQVIATNIDTAFVIESLDRDYSLNRFERYLVLINEGNIKPAIILNKIDLVSKTDLKQIIERIKNRFKDVDVIVTSTVMDIGVDDLKDYIKKSKTYCFLGSSGVGKSSLINKLLNDNKIKTSEIGETTGRGKHTTTAREMYMLENGGLIIDNPGTREVGLTDSKVGIDNVFDEIYDLSNNCRYADCTHLHEPGCAVLIAKENGLLDEEKYHNYTKLKKEADYYQMSEIEKREKDRKFGKFIKSASDQLKKYR